MLEIQNGCLPFSQLTEKHTNRKREKGQGLKKDECVETSYSEKEKKKLLSDCQMRRITAKKVPQKKVKKSYNCQERRFA